ITCRGLRQADAARTFRRIFAGRTERYNLLSRLYLGKLNTRSARFEEAINLSGIKMRDANNDRQLTALPGCYHLAGFGFCDLRMLQVTNREVESCKRENLYYLAPAELHECSQRRTRIDLIAELRSKACHGVQNESYCTAKMRTRKPRRKGCLNFQPAKDRQVSPRALTYL